MLTTETTYLLRLTCDAEGCGVTLEDDYPSADCEGLLIHDARQYGWRIDNEDLCPLHRGDTR